MPTRVDGSLLSWEDVAEQHEWPVLLLGNGLSINVWERFAYRSLFERAQRGDLTPQDLALFEGTPNFERVLGDVSTAIRVAQVAGVDADPFYEHYRRIQVALGHAVRQVHPDRVDIPDDALAAIRNELLYYEWIFTTSYDLIIYWAMGTSERGRFEPFVDLFRWANCEFDPDRADVLAEWIPVYFLHGALHLVVGGTGHTWKLKRTTLQTLLDQFGHPIAGDPHARPLLVTEGSAREKLRAIEANDYLSHALERLRSVEGPLVVFGSRLSLEDDHLVDALNEQPKRPIAISMRPGPQRELAAQQAEIFGRLRADTLLFFDSTTHPLGSPDFRDR